MGFDYFTKSSQSCHIIAMTSKPQQFKLTSGSGETHNFNIAPKWCIQKEGRMITQFENTKLWIDQEVFEVPV